MTPIRWNESLEVAVPELDLDHRRLVDRYNALVMLRLDGARRERLVASLDELVAGVAEHCLAEEAAMERCGYPEVEPHRRHHADLSERLDRFRDAVAAERQEFDDTALLFVRHWLLGHITDQDAEFGRYYAVHCLGEPVGV